MPAGDVQAALLRLDELTRRLRRECPWDREQDERSIVPHTVEEAYELADAAARGDDARLLDELGDVLFQVHFLALLLEERGSGDLALVADRCAEKLIRRHPHVFGEVEVDGAAEVVRNWEEIKRTQESQRTSIFGELPENLPSLLYARKAQRRAEALGRLEPAQATPGAELDAGLARLARASSREERFEALGEILFAVTALGRELDVDAELALRHATERFRERIEQAAAAEQTPGGGESLTGAAEAAGAQS